MINKINDSTNFRAKLVPSIELAGNKRLKNITEMFEEATKNYPGETLYLTKGKYSGVLSIHTNDNKVGDIYQGEEIFTDSLEEHFASMTDKQIVEKLKNAFKVLRLSDLSIEIKNNIRTNEAKLANNLNVAKRLRKIGRDNFAEKYELFAKFNQEKLDKYAKQLQDISNRFYKQRDISAKQFPEVAQVDI